MDRDRPASDRLVFVRFENEAGDGLFSVCTYLRGCLQDRLIRVPDKILREVLALEYQFGRFTPAVASAAYKDTRSRRPITWYRASATEALRIAERLVRILNRYGADLRRVETDRIPTIPWEDEGQIVTRRPRRATLPGVEVLQRRWRDRRKRLARRRQRAGSMRARRAKADQNEHRSRRRTAR